MFDDNGNAFATAHGSLPALRITNSAVVACWSKSASDTVDGVGTLVVVAVVELRFEVVLSLVEHAAATVAAARRPRIAHVLRADRLTAWAN